MEALWALGDIANSAVQAGFNPWTDVIIRPMLNVLMVLYVISLSQMGIAIILFTILVRLVTLPLTVRQIRQMRAMSTLQPSCGKSRPVTHGTALEYLRKPCECIERRGSAPSAA